MTRHQARIQETFLQNWRGSFSEFVLMLKIHEGLALVAVNRAVASYEVTEVWTSVTSGQSILQLGGGELGHDQGRSQTPFLTEVQMCQLPGRGSWPSPLPN